MKPTFELGARQLLEGDAGAAKEVQLYNKTMIAADTYTTIPSFPIMQALLLPAWVCQSRS